METNNDFHFQLIEGIPSNDQIQSLLNVYSTIFEDAQPGFFKDRLYEKNNVLAILALKNNSVVGFKIGYEYDQTTFYSWIGGVIEKHRKKGIAKHLAKLQEQWVGDQGYSKLRTKSMNQFKNMMVLNLKNGFDIKTIYTNDSGQTKIIFEKEI
ncbi:MAG: GNAT family N-acetyltransferase [Flavobacteriaceae bacterium]|nr:GNAT family N-acetyltransferase [Flavobacteriaceae bacterium]